MAVDVVLWFILAAAIAWIWCGCHFTAPARRPRKIADDGIEQKFERAA
jgi:hypothetical protein